MHGEEGGDAGERGGGGDGVVAVVGEIRGFGVKLKIKVNKVFEKYQKSVSSAYQKKEY